MLNKLPIKLKLFLLAGVPVLGAMVLSYMVAVDAQKRLESAKVLGSIEDLARLAETISATVDAIQAERGVTFHAIGQGTSVSAVASKSRQRVDAQVEELEKFFDSRDTSALPPRLAEGIRSAQTKLKGRFEVRKKLESSSVKLDEESALIDQINADLIGATAALTTLSDDGVMLRNISGLVTVMELKERASREQALLSYVFAKSAFPPGGYKALVNLVTEQEVFDKVLRQNTRSDLVELYDSEMKGSAIDRASELRQIGLDTMDDQFGVKSTEWFAVQGRKVAVLGDLSSKLNKRVKIAALKRLRSAKDSVSMSFQVSGAVLLSSLILALIISLGISRSVHALSSAAAEVQNRKDFTIRAEKKSDDELGSLTDAFNQMLDGIQARDTELEDYRTNLEKTVEKRTAELAKRNEAMRVVLDNVEQGLATINYDGSLEPERSAAFNQWFGSTLRGGSPKFSEVLAANDNNLQQMMELGWEGLTDGFLPSDLAADQIPKKLLKDGRHYDLSYKPMGDGDDFRGALLMVSDVTLEIARKEKEAQQREMIAVFEAVMKDRNGFIEFFNETERLVLQVVDDEISDEVVLKRVVHTIKGNSAIYGIHSVAKDCHELETRCLDEQRRPTKEELTSLHSIWSSFAERVRFFAEQGEDDTIEVQHLELEQIISAVKTRSAYGKILAQLTSLKHEPTALRFTRVGQTAKRLAKKLGKGELKVVIEGNQVRLPAENWSYFWSSFIHVIRNALDHGIETPAERVAAGKAEQGMLRLVSRIDGSDFIIEMSDDGRGIDWDRVKAKAKAAGLEHESMSDLVFAIFSDGLSTRDEASDMSGRGVGMGAVKQACEQMSGTVAISSVAGQGTTVRFRIPTSGNDQLGATSVRDGRRPSLSPPPAPSNDSKSRAS